MVLSIEEFAELFMATVAENTLEIRFVKRKYDSDIEVKKASLYFNYRDRIKCILCEENGWEEEFSDLIDMKSYFYDHFLWEQQLSYNIMKIANKYNSKIKFDFVNEVISFEFNQNTINQIFSKYSEKYDDAYYDKMKHLVAIMQSSLYSREHIEKIFDRLALANKKMHTIFEENINKSFYD